MDTAPIPQEDDMHGIRWTYEQLCDFISSMSAVRSSSMAHMNAKAPNPLIQQLLTKCPGSYIWGLGGHSVVLSIPGGIAAKVSLESGGEELRHEQSIFELLDKAPCQYIVHTLFRAPDITFMPIFNGTLHQRMTMVHQPRHVLPWMQQLSDAVASIEALGYAHSDINPGNILLDDQDRIKLVDFDHALKIGDSLDVGYEPYVRFHRHGTTTGGYYGVAGPVTEQFALGSVFWYITRETPLYHNLEGPEQVDRLMDMEFPPTNPDDPIDCIIQDCWNGKFPSVADLSKRVRTVSLFNDTYKEKKKTCERLYTLLTEPCQQGIAPEDHASGDT